MNLESLFNRVDLTDGYVELEVTSRLLAKILPDRVATFLPCLYDDVDIPLQDIDVKHRTFSTGKEEEFDSYIIRYKNFKTATIIIMKQEDTAIKIHSDDWWKGMLSEISAELIYNFY